MQVEICLHLCAGGDGEKTAQDVVVAAHKDSSPAMCSLQRLVQDQTTVHKTCTWPAGRCGGMIE